jgi:capsular polysaccharide biosynthesis protein
LGLGALPRFESLGEARVPERPYFPNRLLFGLAGLVLGVAAGLGAALVAERRDPSVKGPEDLEELLPERLLAVIPLVRVPWFSRRG